MKSLKTNQIKMNSKKIKKEYRRLISSTFNVNIGSKKVRSGVIYTLYSDKFNLLKIGFAQNNEELETRLLVKEFILLDKKKGNKSQLNLIVKTLHELNITFSGDLNFKYSNFLVKHLSTLGWPIGRTLYRPRSIKKELACA